MNSPFVVRASGSASPAFDPDEARRALRLLVDPDARHELRGLPSGRSRLVSGSDLDAAVRSVAALADDRGVYYTLNPLGRDPSGSGGSAVNTDILRRHWFLVDVDPVKDVDHKGDSSTAEEKSSAWFVAQAARAHLGGLGWPDPVVVDSGNGFHLLYRIDLPNDRLAQQWLAACLRALRAAVDTPGATVDKTVHNAARIAKLPGTWARKGVHTEDRPHRLACLASVPAAIVPVDEALVRTLAGVGGHVAEGAAPSAGAADPWTVRAANGSDRAYALSAMEREAGKVALAPGDRNSTLYEAALKLGGYVAAGSLPEAEVVHVLSTAADRAGLGKDGDPGEVGRAIANGLAVGKAAPKHAPARARAAPGLVQAVDTGLLLPDERLTVRASEIRPKAVSWLWRDRVALDFISILAGRTGLGKSFVTCDVAARLTTGRAMPDDTCESPGECHTVLFISEDPYEYVLVPRLMELGADLDLVSFLRWEAMARYTLGDTAFLERACDEAEGPSLIVIDPPANFLGTADEHRNAEVRSVLTHLLSWLNGRGVACVLITHVNKSVGKGIDAVHRILGSVAWGSTSRVAMSIAPDPDDASRCLFSGSKNNLGELAKTLAYRITRTDTLARVDWLGEVDITADQAISGERKAPRQVVASDWLVERFRERLEWPSDDLFRAAKQEGVSRNAIFEAKSALGLPRARKTTDPGGDTSWVWWVPPDWPPFAQDKNGRGG